MIQEIDTSKYLNAKGLIAEILSKATHQSTMVKPWADDSLLLRLALQDIQDVLIGELIDILSQDKKPEPDTKAASPVENDTRGTYSGMSIDLEVYPDSCDIECLYGAEEEQKLMMISDALDSDLYDAICKVVKSYKEKFDTLQAGILPRVVVFGDEFRMKLYPRIDKQDTSGGDMLVWTDKFKNGGEIGELKDAEVDEPKVNLKDALDHLNVSIE